MNRSRWTLTAKTAVTEADQKRTAGGMTPTELRSIGERLYGRRWQTKLAAALPVSTRTVRYWLAGQRAIRPVIAERIKGLAEQERGR